MSARPLWLVSSLFFVTGFTGLAYEVSFSKALGLTFGNTSGALTTVLATYMGGMAFGSWLGGRSRCVRTKRCDFTAIAKRSPRSSARRRPGSWICFDTSMWGSPRVRSALGSFAMLRMVLEAVVPPSSDHSDGETTLPILFSHVQTLGLQRGAAIARLYGANTLGAALGALVTGFVLLPKVGGRDTILLAVGANLLVALTAIVSSRTQSESSPARSEKPKAARVGATPAETEPEKAELADTSSADLNAAKDEPAETDLDPRIGYASLAVSGSLTLALETVYEHLLAVVVGTSVYAFAVMLFAFLLGLSGVRRFSGGSSGSSRASVALR